MPSIERLVAIVFAVSLTLSASASALSACKRDSGETTGDAGTGGGTSGGGTSYGGSSCGALESIECGGPGLPPYRNKHCPADAGVACVQLVNDAAVMHACLPEGECYGDLFVCGGSTDCTGTQRCCADFVGGRIQARCKDDCTGAEVQLCEPDAGCGEGTTCSLHDCPRAQDNVVRACERPVSCD
jgi:hypothetical protein